MKQILSILLFIFTTSLLHAQVVPPQGFSYSGVARDAQNNAISNQTIGIQLTLLIGSPTGSAIYQENHFTSTDSFGVFNLVVGAGAVQSGVFATLPWHIDNYFLQVGVDVSGGSIFQTMGTTQMLSVPYAMYAKQAGSIVGSGGPTGLGKTYLILSGNITDAQASARILAELGSNTQFIWILNTTQLTTATFTGLSEAIEIRIEKNTALQTVAFTNLAACYGPINVGGNNTLTSLSFPALVQANETVSIQGNPALTSVDFSQLTSVNIEMKILNNNPSVLYNLPLLSDVPKLWCTNTNLSVLTSCKYLNVRFTGSGTVPSLTSAEFLYSEGNSISFPSLTTVDTLWFENGTAYSLPLLTTVNKFFRIWASNLNSLNAPLLSTIGEFFQISMSNSNPSGNLNLSFPSLSSVGLYISIFGNSSVNSVNFPSLSNTNGISVENSSITNLTFPSLTNYNGGINVYGNKLTSAAISNILIQMAAMSPPITGRTFNVSGQSPTAYLTPAGLIAKQTLVNNGNNVYHDQ